MRALELANCFVGGSDLAGLNRLAEQLDGTRGLAQLAHVVDRWVYSARLYFALNREQQKRSEFLEGELAEVHLEHR